MRFSRKLSVMAALAAVVVYFGGANAADDKPVNIKGCMKTQNSVSNQLGKMAKAKKPNWEDASKKSKTWLAAAEDMGKNKPPLGGADSWKTQTTLYVTNVKEVDEAVSKKDAAALTKSLAIFKSTCTDCHKVHKPKK